MPNRLAAESSPYLLQHAHNPVDWYPWGDEALARARQEQKPIFLSIGYSACHWCHVMEHESFEDRRIADYLNAHFVCVKVDREERPDLDQIYMTSVQMISGRGGWPMSVFLTPEMEPFFGGTYWPPEPRHGMPGFGQVLIAVIDAWTHRREQALAQASELARRIQSVGASDEAPGMPLSHELLDQAVTTLSRAFDPHHGGFGGAPKFPHTTDLLILLRDWHRTGRESSLRMVTTTLDKMARGGIYDHLGGGFARYSVDERWLVPHFEKMLYDNAQLVTAYLEGFQITRDRHFEQIVRETIDYILAEMTHPQGGFFSTEDADSEGEEGKFYVWTPAEICELLVPDAAERFCYVYDVTEPGNFEGKNILNRPKTIEQCAQLKGWDARLLEAELSSARERLFARRNERVRPGRDDKVLVSWNALMIDALARAGATLGEERYLDAARKAARFLLTQLRQENGRLWHAWRNDVARFPAYQDDYAYLANALVSLYEATFEEPWIDEAVALVEIMRRHFGDPDHGGFFYTADDHERLIARQKDFFDSSVPSGNGMAALVLLRLGHLLGRQDYRMQARETLDAGLRVVGNSATAAAQLLVALDFHLAPPKEIAILGDLASSDCGEVVADLRRRFIPNKLVALRRQAAMEGSSWYLDPLFQGRQEAMPGPTIYVCQGFVCQSPLVGKRAALEAWQSMCQSLGNG